MRTWFVIGSLMGALAVIMGAFGAHALKARLSADLLAVFETGARYHLIHAVLLLIVGLAAGAWPTERLVTAAGALVLGGIVIFSGSLYALSISGLRVLGAITPIGGLCLILGWLCLAMAAFRH